MKKLPFLFVFFVLISCLEPDIGQFEGIQQDTVTTLPQIVTDASGREYPGLDPRGIPYCGPFWGRKFCRFLRKYDGTIWADSENYYSDFSDIKFSNFANNYFISFFNLDTITSYCEGWKLGETTYDGNKWEIKIKIDEEDLFLLNYDYYGSSEELKYTITYRYEVIDGLLHFSRSEGQTFIFHPSEKNYSEDAIQTDEMIVLEGCLFF